MTRLELGERFKDARTVHNQYGKQTMDDVSAVTGVSKTVIQALEKIESCDIKRDVGFSNIIALAKHYGVSADWLLGLSEDHKIVPSATGELGLSEGAVNYFIDLKRKSTSDHNLSSDICALIEQPAFQSFMYRVRDYCNSVTAELLYDQLLEKYTPTAFYANQSNIADERIGYAIKLLALSEQYNSEVIDYLNTIHAFADKQTPNTNLARALFGGEWIIPSDLCAHRASKELTLLMEELRENAQNMLKKNEVLTDGNN